MLVSNLWAITVEMKPERIEKNKPFIFSIVLSKREIPKKYEFPEIGNIKEFTLLRRDTIEAVSRDFFGRSHKVLKLRFHMKTAKTGVIKIGPIYWTYNDKRAHIGSHTFKIERGYGASGLSVRGRVDSHKPFQGEQIRYRLNYGAYSNFQSGPYPIEIGFGKDFWGTFSDEKLTWKRKPESNFMASTQQFAYLTPIQSGKILLPKMGFKYSKKGEPKRVV